jgi:hypothetical protein
MPDGWWLCDVEAFGIGSKLGSYTATAPTPFGSANAVKAPDICCSPAIIGSRNGGGIKGGIVVRGLPGPELIVLCVVSAFFCIM